MTKSNCTHEFFLFTLFSQLTSEHLKCNRHDKANEVCQNHKCTKKENTLSSRGDFLVTPIQLHTQNIYCQN